MEFFASLFAELLLADDGNKVSGKYLFRKKKSDDELILSVIYKGAASHHTLTRDGDGEEWSLNKTPSGCTTLAEVRQLACTGYHIAETPELHTRPHDRSASHFTHPNCRSPIGIASVVTAPPLRGKLLLCQCVILLRVRVPATTGPGALQPKKTEVACSIDRGCACWRWQSAAASCGTRT